MTRTSHERSRGRLERLLKWVLLVIILVNLLLVVPARVSYIRLDLIDPSLPAISLEPLQLTNLAFIKRLLPQPGNSDSASAWAQPSAWIGPSATPTGEIAVTTGETAPPATLPLQATSSIAPGTTASPTGTRLATMTPTPSPTATVTPTGLPSPSLTPSSASPTASSEKTHYVAPKGDDSAPGTASQPWKTIQHAAAVMQPGDTTFVLAGDYSERVQVTRSGASGSPITFKAQGTVTMKGFTVKADYISIIGFDISNTASSTNDAVGIYVLGSFCDIEDNYVHFATQGGILLWANTGQYAKTSNCVVRNNRLYRNGMMGISVMGQDHLVEDNEIWGTIQYHPNWTNPPSWVDADGITFFGSGHVFRHNYIHDIHYGIPENPNPHIDCFQTYGGDKTAGHDILFDGNYCDNPDTLPELSLAGKAFQVEGGSHDLVIRNNITISNLVAIFNSTHDITIINNTFFGNPNSEYSQGIQMKDSPHFTIQNNIFAYQENGTGSISLDSASESGLKVGYNCVFRNSGDPARPPDPNDVWGLNPLFVNEDAGDFHLQSGSPCVDSGKDLGDSVRRDYDGKRRPQGSTYDIGAFEQ